MNTVLSELKTTIQDVVVSGKGILAADESSSTIKKRFDTIHLESTEDNRRHYRDMLFTAPDLEEYISGVILYEETLNQKAISGIPFPELLTKKGIVPGIKVDLGLTDFESCPREQVTKGLDGLPERIANYKKKGARFAKWRAVFNISDTLPSPLAVKTSAGLLARYAAICQAYGIVPIVEPEVLMDGNHSLERCSEVSQKVLHAVFDALYTYNVFLEYIILKPSMIIAGQDYEPQPSIETVAKETVNVLRRHVPSAVPGILFLSGGQSDEIATAHLNEMNKLGPLPWVLSYSYGRALQTPALKAWAGQAKNVIAGQKALIKRSKLNSLASLGKYSASLESKT